MKEYKKGDIVEGKVTGIEPYGIFVSIDNKYTGLIHISEIDNNFIKDVNDYVKIGDSIYVNIIGLNEKNGHLNLSIKNINYQKDNSNKKIEESISGFLPLSKQLPEWIKESKKKEQ